MLQFSILCQFHFKFHVSRSGVRIPVKATFCDVTPMTTHTNQSIDKVIQKIFSIDWPWQKVGKRKKAKKLSWLGFEPQTWKNGIWSGIGSATVHSVPMGVHWAACSFCVKIIMSRGVYMVPQYCSYLLGKRGNVNTHIKAVYYRTRVRDFFDPSV